MLYLFQLGHQPKISAAEIEAVLCLLKIKTNKILTVKNNNYLILETKEKIETQKLIQRLGGTIKIGYYLESPQGQLTSTLLAYLLDNFSTGKIEFSINEPRIALQIKKELKSLGRNVRYIEPKNSATILHNKLLEKKSDFTILENKIFVSEALQPFEDFSARDYGRPGSDDKSGMLPPKLARIMLNLSQTKINSLILDPFCGSGTVLTEAISLGYQNLIGSDISEKAIKDTEKNLNWLKTEYQLPIISYQLLITDATKLSSQIKYESIDTIVTEPYLGKPLHGNETENFIIKQTEELKNLYLNSFKEFYKILKSKGTVIMVIPKFKIKNHWFSIDIKNEVEKIGFIIQPFTDEGPLLYHRQDQHLGREIWKFNKTG